MSTVRKLFSINAIIALSLGIGFINNVAISGFFGLNRFVDAYFAAAILGKMFMYLIVDYLGRNFLPVYAARYRESPEQAAQMASTVITLMALVASGTVVALLYFSEPIFAFLLPGFGPEEVQIVTVMFSIQAPAIVLMTVNNFHQFIWQHDEHYNRVVFARLFVSLTLLIFIIGGYLVGNVYALAAGLFGGHLMAGFILAYKAPYRFRPSLDLKNSDVKKILTNSALLTGSGLITRLRGPIQQYFASLLGEGAISAMQIAYKMTTPINESLLLGVRMIVFSKSSKQAARGDYRKLADLYDYALSAVLLGIIPIAFWMGMNARPVIDVVFLRGEFTTDMAALVTIALLGAVVGITFKAIQQLLSNSFYALQKIIVPLIAMPAGTIIFYFAAEHLTESNGLFGLMLANSVVAGIVSMVLLFALSRVLEEFSAGKIVRRMFLYAIPAGIFCFLGDWLAEYLQLSGILRLILTFAVLGVGYIATLYVASESIFARALTSVIRATKGRQATEGA